MIIKLTRPQTINGSEIEEINLELEPLKGKDIIELETGFRALYKDYVPIPDIDPRYQAMVAGRCSKINPKDLEELDAPDFKAVCRAVRDFLLV
jgi:hypothetical protein